MIEFRNNSIKLQIWDSAGQERYKALIPSYVRGAAIIFIIYDISDYKTFANLESWINFIKQVNTDESLLILCGNKSDLERKINYKEGYELAKKNGMMFFETSAKTGENINEIFTKSVSKIAENIEKNVYDLKNEACGIRVGLNRESFVLGEDNSENNNTKKTKKKCC